MNPNSTTRPCASHADRDWIIGGIKGEFYPCKPDVDEAICPMKKDEMQ